MLVTGERQTPRTILVLIAVCLTAVPSHAKYGGGSGTADDPYQIRTAEQMNAIGAEPNDWDKHFKLMADIDLSGFDGRDGGLGFNVIAPDTHAAKRGFQGMPFSGVFDGDGHTISDFRYYAKHGDYTGLFGCVSGPRAEIRNLGLSNPIIDAGDGTSVGALVGFNGGLVTNCYGDGDVSGRSAVGGLVGSNMGIVTRCHYAGAARGGGLVGGLVGDNDTDGAITRSYSTGKVNTSKSVFIGGLVGRNAGDIIDCYSTAAVSGGSEIGGLVGRNDDAGVVTRCYSVGRVSDARVYIGGLIGHSLGTVTDCYSCGPVDGEEWIAGGLVGQGDNRGCIIRCLWDREASGRRVSGAGTGFTTAEMRKTQTYLFQGWDFVGETRNGASELWQMPKGGGYPIQTAMSNYVPPRLEGSGSPQDPYLICDIMELGAIVHYSENACYRLTTELDLAGIHWHPAVIPRFAGTFDGNGLTISHLTVEGGPYLGLFGRLKSGSVVRDLGLVDARVRGVFRCVGALAGENAGTIVRCYSTGETAGSSVDLGGLVGMNSGDITDCHSDAEVAGYGLVGGLLGWNAAGRVTRCYSTGPVRWGCYYTNFGATGGLAGSNDGAVTQCYSTGIVSSLGCESTGGLIGSNSGTVMDCYSGGAADSTLSNVGGLAGRNSGTLSNCYSFGGVTGTGPEIGGLVGYGWATSHGEPPLIMGTVLNCFWDVQTSGWATSSGGTGKATPEMWTASTYLTAGWDFVGEVANGTEDVWRIVEGRDYPRLRWELVNP